GNRDCPRTRNASRYRPPLVAVQPQLKAQMEAPDSQYRPRAAERRDEVCRQLVAASGIAISPTAARQASAPGRAEKSARGLCAPCTCSATPSCGRPLTWSCALTTGSPG